MIPLFDLSAGLSGTKLLTKILRDRSPAKKGRQEEAEKIVPDSGDGCIEDKMVIHETKICSNNQSCGTKPMKMLIAQEMMSKELETWKQKPPTVIARLMGLDVLPPKIPDMLNQPKPKCTIHNSCTSCGTIWNMLEEERIHHEGLVPLGDRPFQYLHHSDHKSYKDSYEVKQTAPSGFARKISVEKNSIDEKMSIVRQKFMEAKRLATNKRLLHSKAFQEALEVLSSNRDIFLKVLEEPNSLISKNKELEIDASSMPGQSNKKITVLKPSKEYDETRSEHGSTSFSCKTRIVVLRPCPEKLQGIPNPSENKLLFDKLGSDDGPREVSKEMTQSMRESLRCTYRLDETGVSPSVLSNGYIGDESSFNRSEDEYMEDEYDSEIATPISQQSLGYTRRFYSHTSKFQESSVIKEAKKRLSDRWVTLKSNKINKEPRKEWSGTSTLGDMLAIRAANTEEPNLMSASSCFSSNWNEIEKDEIFSLSLQRWKSTPLTSSYSVNNKAELDMEKRSEFYVGKSDDMSRLKRRRPTTKKGMVSNFLFSRTKKYTQQNPSSSFNSEYHEGSSDTSEKKLVNKDFNPISAENRDDQVMLSLEQCFYCEDACEKNKMEYSVPYSSIEPSVVSSLEHCLSYENEHSVLPLDFEPPSRSSLVQYLSTENACGNLDDSIPLFELPSRSIFSEYFDSPSIGSQRTISRSTPIESVARSLSWDASTSSGRTLNTLKHPNNFVQEVERHERHMFVQSLLSSVGLGTTETLNTFLPKWHSLESPLNPALLENHLLEQKVKGQMCNEKKSNERLLFDCVNSALMDISSWRGGCVILSINLLRKLSMESDATSSSSLADDISKFIEDLFSTENKSLAFRCNSNFELDTIVRNEVSGGKEWSDMMGSEITQLGMLIESHVLDELFGEILEDFISSHHKHKLVVTYCS